MSINATFRPDAHSQPLLDPGIGNILTRCSTGNAVSVGRYGPPGGAPATPHFGLILKQLLILVSVVVLTSCSDQETSMISNARHFTLETGANFAKALVSNKFSEARSYLTSEAQKEYTQEVLASHYRNMVSYGSGPVAVDGHAEFMDSWPARQPQDIGWAYISISGSDFAEAVTVVVSDEGGSPRIREIEWGRP